MATPANIIPVPKPSRSAHNPDRPLTRNTLVQAQVKHFAEADKNLPPELQSGVDINSITSEGEAAAYIRKVTEAIKKNHAGKVQRAG